MEKHEFINGVRFMLRDSDVLEYSEKESTNPLLKNVPVRVCFRPDAPEERMHIELRSAGIVFWTLIAGVEVKSNLHFYGNIIKIGNN
jgi:hypothetical protein